MNVKVFVGLILLSLAGGIILSIAPTVSAEATVIDTTGSETKVYDLYLYHRWCDSPNPYDPDDCWIRDSETTRSIEIEKGEAELTIPFSNILKMEFDWAELGMGKPLSRLPSVTIITLDGERIKGRRVYFSEGAVGYGDTTSSFKGKTDYGDFELPMTKTKKVIFSHEITPTSTTPTVTLTSSPAATPALVPTPMTTQTPTSSPNQIPTPIPRPPGFETVFVLIAVLAVSLLIRWRQTK